MTFKQQVAPPPRKSKIVAVERMSDGSNEWSYTDYSAGEIYPFYHVKASSPKREDGHYFDDYEEAECCAAYLCGINGGYELVTLDGIDSLPAGQKVSRHLGYI